jgi:Icc-related predicted phosphoesterase
MTTPNMQLLLFSDVHTDRNAGRRLVDQSEEADIVVGAGDFCDMRRGLDATIDVLSAIQTPTVVVPGNSETADELRAACAAWPSAHVLHGDGIKLQGISFFGIGGGVPVTPFGAWSVDYTEAEAEVLLAGCPDRAVLVSHSPPQGVVDQDSSGQHLGSTAVRRAIEEHTPRLTVCGHIHGSWGEEAELAGTPVVNAGPSGIWWTLDAASAR